MTEKRKTETIRDSLLAQIAVIRDVDGDRYTWPHVLDEVAKALPAYTWLVDMSVSSAPTAVADSADTASAALQFQINGRTVDIQAYTRFLRQLEASPWIIDVQPLQAQTVVEKERAVTAFTIRATFAQADSAYIRTVPMSQSVR
jgi:Tfp pilus assembly protein PilN